MAKRRQVAETTTDGRFTPDREGDGGPDQTVELARMVSSEQLKERLIKQPKSRFPTAGTIPRPSVPQPTFSFGNAALSTPTITPNPASNGSSGQLFGVPTTPTPASFPTLNGAPTTPAQQSLTKANPFASLATYTPEGKPPAPLFSTSTTPVGMPVPPFTPAGVPQFNFGSPVGKGWTPTTTSGFKPNVSEFGFSNPAVTPSKSTGQNPAVSESTLGSLTPKKDVENETGVPKMASPGLSEFNGDKKDDSMKSQDIWGSSNKLPNPFSGLFTPKPLTPAAASPISPDTGVVSAGVSEKDFKVKEFKGVDGELSREKQNKSASGSPKERHVDPFQSPKPTLDSLSGSDTSVNVNGLSSASEDVAYPSLPPVLSTPASSTSTTTNGISARSSPTPMAITFEVPPPPANFTSAQKDEWDKKYRIQVLNSTLLRFLQNSDPAGDWRDALAVHGKLFEEITRGTTKRKSELQNDTEEHGSPKRSKTDHEKPAVSTAAKVLEDIVDKNIGPSSSSLMKQNEPLKSSPNIFNSQSYQTSTTEKPTSPVTPILGGNIFTARSTPTTTPTNNTSKVTSTLFGPGGGAAIGAPPAPAGGLFSNLQPTLSGTKDKGEEDSPEKSKTGGLLFGAGFTAPPPAPRFVFGAPSTVATPERPTQSGLFSNTPKPVGDQTWKPDSPIRFGGPSTSTAPSNLFSSSNNSIAPFIAPASNIAQPKTTTTAGTTTDIPPPPYSFCSNSSLVPSFEGAGSGVSTPATSSDLESRAEGSSSGNSGNNNEPSDEVRAEKVDLSGPGPGEENDEVIYSARVAVYVKDDKGLMKKVAVGASRVLKNKDNGTARFLVRTEQGKAVVNVRLQKQVQYTALPDKKIILIPDFSGGGMPKLYTVRTKDGEVVKELSRSIVNVMG